MRLRFLLLLLLAGALLFSGWLLIGLPSLDQLQQPPTVPSVRIVDRDGVLLYDSIDRDGGRQRTLSLDQIAPHVVQALIATEDRNYYQHPGVDIEGIVRAFVINARGGEVVAGGSTITQQVARNLLLESQERTVRRKLRESWLAWRIARRYSKEEVLALYLNQMYFGAHAYGIEAAANTFFAKAAADLTTAEGAFLVGLLQAPAYYNPFTNFEAAKQRQQTVLDLMLHAQMIDEATRDRAIRQPLRLAATPHPLNAPHFVAMVQSEVDRLFTPEQIVQHGGLTVRTTLEWQQQQAAEVIVRRQVERLLQDGHNAHSAALVALDPHSGDVLALVGNVDYFNPAGGAINMATAPRQPGSALKPMVYAAALSMPEPWSAATMIEDVRTTFITAEGEPYVPVNFDRKQHGPVLVRDALASSLNISAVKALERVGIEPMIATLADYGIRLDPSQTHGLALALGGGEVTLLELTGGYAVFANGGNRIEPRLILDVTTATGEVVHQTTPSTLTPILDERVAWLISDMLSDDSARERGFGIGSVLNIDRTAAVKTGTTNDFRDNWTIGYTPDLVAGVWVGNVTNEPMVNVTGISGAGPIWHSFMRAALKGVADQTFKRPSGMLAADVCLLSGQLANDRCPLQRREWFIDGTQPTLYDQFFRSVTLDSRDWTLATAATPPAFVSEHWALDLPPALHEWARAEGWLLIDDLLPHNQEHQVADRPLHLTSPDDLTVYRLSTAVPLETQQIRLAAAAQLPIEHIEFLVNDRVVARLQRPPFETWWQLEPGEWQVIARAQTPTGVISSDTITIRVLSADEAQPQAAP